VSVCVLFTNDSVYVHNHFVTETQDCDFFFVVVYLSFSLIQSVVVVVVVTLVCVNHWMLSCIQSLFTSKRRHFCHVTCLSTHDFNTIFDINTLHSCYDSWCSVDCSILM